MKAPLLFIWIAVSFTLVSTVHAQPSGARNSGPKGSMSGQERARPPSTNKESAALRQEARAALRSGNLDEVARVLSIARRIKLKGEREAWQVFEAEYCITKKEYQTAALAAMRLVVLSPKSPYYGEALFWAAKAYEGMGRPEKALELYRECVEHKSSDEHTVRRAKSAIKPLTTQRAKPEDAS